MRTGMEPLKRKWAVIAPFFTGRNDRWLDDFVEDEDIDMVKVAAPREERSWHNRSAAEKILRWVGHLRHVVLAFRMRPHGIVTSFPQLAIIAGLAKRLTGSEVVIVAHNFNMGTTKGGAARRLARFAAGGIDAFIVHSPAEIAPYAAYLDMPESRFTFVPLQRSRPVVLKPSLPTVPPYILAMGSAYRDYPTLLAATEGLGIDLVIVSGEELIADLPKREDVRYLSGLSQQECLQLLAAARLSVTPTAEGATAAGQITFINAMFMGVPVIATRGPGTLGYLEDQRSALLVEPGDVEGLRRTVLALWEDEPRRKELARRAEGFATGRLDDRTAARSMVEVMRLAGQRRDVTVNAETLTP